ncbi:hypothetical protein KAW15_01430 [Bifidobacterium animalis subsp. lactis]|nr:hypothetical protein [Bifidobacterium animalis subsp. lactis]MBS4804890.1 hypothetical protein [Bifidobacterium animalis]MBU9869404.1 hypothetical protein [Bifidobacterium animalis]MBU9948676.1 hypothetical protein [Bifidobacterium animalis]MBV3323012.1 hypothetical protein [Bifidobacterium animalis]
MFRILNRTILFNSLDMFKIGVWTHVFNLCEGFRIIVERHALACQPIRVHPQHSREESLNIAARSCFAAHILTDVAAPQLDSMVLRRFDEVDLLDVAQLHRLIEARGEIGHAVPPLNLEHKCFFEAYRNG